MTVDEFGPTDNVATGGWGVFGAKRFTFGGGGGVAGSCDGVVVTAALVIGARPDTVTVFVAGLIVTSIADCAVLRTWSVCSPKCFSRCFLRAPVAVFVEKCF